ncbi:MAG: hypothetical protein ACD_79C00484G0003 [uncultured bacterium]|nr:MAG: hypothetical protein ACD_79C00484G0003 [uncultured bacterium]
MAENRRIDYRKDVQVIVHFNLHGHEKVFQAFTRNISLSGLFIETEEDILEMIQKGESIVVMMEYKTNLFVKIKCYVIRVDMQKETFGFAIKYLELDENQQEAIEQILT